MKYNINRLTKANYTAKFSIVLGYLQETISHLFKQKDANSVTKV